MLCYICNDHKLISTNLTVFNKIYITGTHDCNLNSIAVIVIWRINTLHLLLLQQGVRTGRLQHIADLEAPDLVQIGIWSTR